MALVNPQSRTETQLNMSLNIFKELYVKYGESLSCPCSQIHIPHKDFTLNKIRFHSICSSIFITDQWIDALYQIDGSGFDTLDFRQTAHSQVNEDFI